MKKFTESRLALGAGELWDLDTRAEFLNAVGDGSLPEDAFNRWLVQDYLFVRGFAGFASLTVGKTPRPGQSVLIAGLSALDDELDWFEAHAETRSLDLGAELHPACQHYVDFLITAGYSEPFQGCCLHSSTVSRWPMRSRGVVSRSGGRTPSLSTGGPMRTSKPTCVSCRRSPTSIPIPVSNRCSTRSCAMSGIFGA